MVIYENQTYEIYDVISIRRKMDYQDVKQELINLDIFLSTHNIERGSIITVTHGIERGSDKQVLDFEILCSIKPKTILPEFYEYKPIFRITNALKIIHYGNPNSLQIDSQKLLDYAKEKNLTPITGLYCVTVNQIKSLDEIDKMEVDIYLGITSNIL